MFKKIKILHVTQVSGGIQTYIEQILKNIDRDRFEIVLACPKEQESLIKMAYTNNIEFIALDLKWEIAPLHDFKSIISIAKIIKKVNPDIIHAHSSKAGMITRITGFFFRVKTLYTPNAYAYLGSKGIKRFFFFYIEKLAIYITDILLASSQSEAYRSTEDLKFPKEKVKVYPNSIEILDSLPEYASPGLKIISTAGRLAHQKNPLMFLRVCEIISKTRGDVHFKMIGVGFEDSLKSDILKYIKERRLTNRVSLINWMDRGDLLSEIRNSEVFVMTSAFESFGYVAAEAQMLEIPVVATNVDGLKEIVEHNSTGFLVELNDDEEMARKILYLIDSPEKSRKMGENGRIKMEMLFNIKTNIKILEDFYTQYSL